MKNKFFSLCLVLLCVALSFSFVACSDNDKGDGDKVPAETDTFVPATDLGEESELYKRHAEYSENATLAFKNHGVTDSIAFEYEETEDGVAIKLYRGDDNIVVVPDSINGKPVVEISAHSFSGTALRAVYIPDSVKTIGKESFDDCNGLSTLRLPVLGDGGDNAFLGYIFGASAPDENAVTVPPSLDMLILGENTTEIAADAFLGCKTLSAVVLPDSVKSIGAAAFYECADLVYLSLGSGIEDIGEYAFAYCRALYSVDISMADTVGNGALFNCSALNNVKLMTSDNEFLGRIFGAEKPEYNADFVSESLRCVEIADGSKIIPDRMFSSCKYITEVILPKSLETIGIRAFYACRSLGKIEMHSVKTVSDDAFFCCDNLAEVELGDSLSSLGMQTFFGCEALKSVKIPDTLTELKASTFCGCSSLVTVELGGVKKIGMDAFSGCVKLTPVSTEGVEVAKGNGALMPSAEE